METQGSEILNELLKSVNEVNYKPNQTEVRQLFIGNLPFRVRWQDIKDLFRKAGHVVRADVALNYENRSKGHGTVLFTSVEDAQKAIEMFNGYKWQGRILEVRGDRGFVENNKNDDKKLVSPLSSKSSSPAIKEKKEISVKSKDKKEEQEEEDDDDCRQLFIGNLPFHCQWQDLKDLFRNSGRILRADVVLNFDGRSRGFGTVLFSSHKDAKSAIEQYNGFELDGRILRVHFDKFAATHAKLREEEANTYGQRQIHDPASLELLRQTYLPPQPPLPYGLSTLIPQQQQSSSFNYYGHTNTTTTTITNTQSNYSPLTTQQQMPFTNMYHNGMYGYQHSPSFTTNNMYGYPTQYWMQQQHSMYQQPNNELNELSNSINTLNIHNNTSTTSPNSAGLNKKDWY